MLRRMQIRNLTTVDTVISVSSFRMKVAYMEESHLCPGCDYLVCHVTLRSGEKVSTGCECPEIEDTEKLELDFEEWMTVTP